MSQGLQHDKHRPRGTRCRHRLVSSRAPAFTFTPYRSIWSSAESSISPAVHCNICNRLKYIEILQSCLPLPSQVGVFETSPGALLECRHGSTTSVCWGWLDRQYRQWTMVPYGALWCPMVPYGALWCPSSASKVPSAQGPRAPASLWLGQPFEGDRRWQAVTGGDRWQRRAAHSAFRSFRSFCSLLLPRILTF